MRTASATSEQLLDVAHGLILQGGYRGFSYADLAAVVGIRKASIHHHFPTKAELVRTLAHRYRERFRGMSTGLPRLPTLAAKLDAYAAYWSACIEDGSQPICLMVLLATEMPSLPPEVAQEVRGYFLDLSELIQAAFEVAGAAAPSVQAEAFLAVAHGAMISARAVERPELFDTVVRGWLRDASLAPPVDSTLADRG